MRELGHFLGVNALYRIDGEKNPLRLFAESFLDARPAAGLLADPRRFTSWSSGLVVGAREDLTERPEADVADFAAFARAAWRAAESVANELQDDEHLSGRFGLFVVGWFVDELKRKGVETRDLRRAWSGLSPLVCDVLSAGNRADVFDVVFALRECPKFDRLGAESLLDVAHAIIRRAAAEDPRHLHDRIGQGHSWMHA